MSAKRSGEWVKQVLWPTVAGLAVWLASGGMPAGLERGFVAVLWGSAALAGIAALLVGATIAVGFGTPKPRAEQPAPTRPGWRDVLVDVARVVLVLALLAAGRPVLGVWFAFCLIGFRLFLHWLRKREFPGRHGTTAR